MDDYAIGGYENECDFAKHLNGKRIKELYPHDQNMIYQLYGKVNANSIVKANVSYAKKKYDLIININGIKKGVSIKKGINNSVHLERISSFIHFLIEAGVPRYNVIRYLKYHYADGTMNGSGEVRLSAKEYKENHAEDIEKLNLCFSDPVLVKKAIQRFVVQGWNGNIPIDGLIYGVVSDYLFITTEEIENIIMSKINISSSGPHFSCLFCQPLSRNLNNNSKNERCRYLVQIKWYTIFDDIIEYMNDKENIKDS